MKIEKIKKIASVIFIIVLLAVFVSKFVNGSDVEFSPTSYEVTGSTLSEIQTENNYELIDLNNIPKYDDKPYVVINNNEPFFKESELTNISFETYSEWDSLGRCGVCTACVGQDIMPKDDRGDISSVKPSGWINKKYEFIDGGYLYNRCHLLGFQLTGENANKRNLITGTRYLNVTGMLPFENMVADYVKETDEHCMYRVTPMYKENNLVASGVLMEGYSVEDKGESVCFCVYCYNVQPGVEIDYATGNSQLKK